MDLGHVDFQAHKFQKKSEGLKQPVAMSFNDELLSKMNATSQAVMGAEELQKQSLLKAKRKKVLLTSKDEGEDESVLSIVRDIKLRLKKIRALERWTLGI